MERRRLVRVPASSANLGPGLRRARRRAGAPPGARGRGDRGVRGRDRARRAARPLATCASAAFERLHPRRRLHLPDPLRDPAGGRPGLERRGHRRRAVAADHMFELDADVLARRDASSRAIPTTRPPRCSAASSSAPTARPRASTPPAGLEAVLVVPDEAVRTEEARAALPAEVPMADAVFNVAHAVAARARPGPRRLGPRRPRPRRPPAPAAPRAPVPALAGAGRAGRRARRAGRDDLGRRPDRARLDALRADGRRRSSACGPRPGLGAGAPVPFEPQGAEVRALG